MFEDLGKIDIIPISIDVAKQADPFARKENFVRGEDVYILGSFKNASKQKNRAFGRRIADAGNEARNTRFDDTMMIVPNNWVRNPDADIPTVNLYVNCPDEEMYDGAYDAISALNQVRESGVRIKLHIVGNQNGIVAQVFRMAFGHGGGRHPNGPTHTR